MTILPHGWVTVMVGTTVFESKFYFQRVLANMLNHQSSPYDIYFRFLGFPVQIQPFFWIVFGLFGVGFHRNIENMAFWFFDIAIWIAAAFVSILVHELGHALVFHYVFRVPSSITIHGFGGVTIPKYPPPRKYGFGGMLYNVFLSAAGPLAGFIMAGLILVFLDWWMTIQGEAFFKNGLDVAAVNVQAILLSFLASVAGISILWGFFNLLPIYPMDGGHIAREIFSYFFPRNGVSNSLVLSMAVAILLAVLAFRFGQPFIAFLFAYFAYQNYQELSFSSLRRW